MHGEIVENENPPGHSVEFLELLGISNNLSIVLSGRTMDI